MEVIRANAEAQETAQAMPLSAASGVTAKKQVIPTEIQTPENVEAQGIALAGHPTAANGDIAKKLEVEEVKIWMGNKYSLRLE